MQDDHPYFNDKILILDTFPQTLLLTLQLFIVGFFKDQAENFHHDAWPGLKAQCLSTHMYTHPLV
jgi:hypothetical protein